MKINLKWIITAWLLFLSWASYAQDWIKDKKTIDEICECFSSKKNIIVRDKIKLHKEILDHDTLMSMNVYELAKIYWDQYLDTINRHMLIELNKFRVENWKSPLELDPKIQAVSQDFANYLFSTNKDNPDHWEWEQSLKERLIKVGIYPEVGCENLSAWTSEPMRTFCVLINSEWHKENFLMDSLKYFWLGIAISEVKDIEYNWEKNNNWSNYMDDRDSLVGGKNTWNVPMDGKGNYLVSDEKLYSIRIFTLIWDY